MKKSVQILMIITVLFVLILVSAGFFSNLTGKAISEEDPYIKTKRNGRFLGVVNVSMDVKEKFNPSTGNVFDVEKPVWAALVAGEDKSRGVGKVTICHIPTDNPNNPKTVTITVGGPAVDVHLSKGDYLGPCNEGGGGGGGVEECDNALSVAALRIPKGAYSSTTLQTKINNLISAHPETDLIVTPEFLFYSDYKEDPVLINCEYGLCAVASIGTQKSNQIKQAVELMRNVARNNNLSIVLGTLSERVTIEGKTISISTQLIINKNGDLIGKHSAAKKSEFYSPSISDCEQLTGFCDAIEQYQLSTAKTFVLTTRNNLQFKILPTVCGEKDKQFFIDKLIGSNADLIVDSSLDRDFDYQDMMSRIQNGEDIFSGASLYSPEGILKNEIFDEYISKNIIASSTYIVSSNGDGIINGANGGILNSEQTPITNVDITTDYVSGKLCL